LPQLVRGEAEALGPAVKAWIELYGFSPIQALFSPTKAELWLNMSLVSSLRDRIKIFLRRMVPVDGSGIVSFGGSGAPRGILRRASHHIRTLGPTLAEGVAWWRIQNAAGSVRHTAEAQPAVRGV
jgi:hypothetical protein